ncbi:MAG: protein-disulfide reductase DsbD family protein [Acuticoccus sp.]
MALSRFHRLPPSVDAQGSQNVASLDLIFPAPERFVAFGIEALGYSERVTFPVRVKRKDPSRGATLSLTVEILVCSNVCVPERFVFNALIPAEPAFLPALDDTPIQAALARVPVAAIDEDVALSQLTVDTDAVIVELKAFGDGGAGLKNALVVAEIPDEDPLIGRLRPAGGGLFTASLDAAELPVIGSNLRITVVGSGKALDLTGAVTKALPQQANSTLPGLAVIIVIAFLGGLILNVMPCVLPVLSIKLTALGRTATLENGQQRLAFLATAGGILAFVGLLGAVLGVLKALGHDVFWGMQFQSPTFVTLIFVLFTLMTLNLAGLFEVRLPSALQNRLGRLGRAGDFADGFVIALVATPCSAPFLGTAISFGLAGGSGDLALSFAALGMGFAFPYLAVAVAPRAAIFLPKPGAWMRWVQRTLVLPMLVVLLWLGSLLLAQGGLVALAAALAVACMAVFVARRPSRGLAAAGLAVAVAAVAFVAVEGSSPDAEPKRSAEKALWQAFDRTVIDRHVQDGQVVFVDVTADWCITCLYNKAAALDRESVVEVLARGDTVAMRADWTLPDDTIAAFVKSQGRYGIPLNVAFGPGRPEGVLLPEILTVTSVLDAIEEARGGATPTLASKKE